MIRFPKAMWAENVVAFSAHMALGKLAGAHVLVLAGAFCLRDSQSARLVYLFLGVVYLLEFLLRRAPHVLAE